MTRPKLLDLFCCEGGASEGYRRAGFDVYGIDLFIDYTQKRYPFASHKGDAILALARLLAGEALPFTHKDGTVEWLTLADFDAIAASPPCQAYSITKHSHSNEHPDLVGPVRYLLRATGLPYVMENVPGAPLDNPITLCGAEFGLTAEDVDGTLLHLKRHRLFESDVFLVGLGGCRCVEFKRRGYAVGGAYGGGSVDRAHAKNVRRGGYTPSKPIREAPVGDRLDDTTRPVAVHPARLYGAPGVAAPRAHRERACRMSDDLTVRHDATPFGFRWGPMTVTRIASYEPRKGFRAHILGIKTDRADVQVYVTPTGLVRIWKNGEEVTA